MVGISKVGDRIPVEVIRDGNKTTLTVVIAQLADSGMSESSNIPGKPGQKSNNVFNLVVQNISKQQREELEIDDHGVIVEEVSDGPAQQAGIRRGDVILLINNIKIKDAEHFQSLTKDLPAGKSIPILIQRRGGPIFLAIKIEEDNKN